MTFYCTVRDHIPAVAITSRQEPEQGFLSKSRDHSPAVVIIM